MGGTATHSKAVALGCHYGAANRRLSRSTSGQAILWLWISSVDLSWRAAEICPHRTPGPMILVDPASKLVMVHTAVRQKPSGSNAETIALWLAVLEHLGK